MNAKVEQEHKASKTQLSDIMFIIINLIIILLKHQLVYMYNVSIQHTYDLYTFLEITVSP